MTYNVISADSHLDLIWLPNDLFVSRAPKALRDRMPQVVETSEGKVWVAEGKVLGVVAGGALSGDWGEYKPGESRRLDRMAETGFFSDGERGLYHPSTPELRVKDQKLDGIDAEVIYGVLGLGTASEGVTSAASGISDPEVLTTVYDIYNQWIEEFCRSQPDRLIGLACIASHDPQTAVDQLERAASLGLKGAEFNAATAVKPIYHHDWDPLWAVAAEHSLPISFHSLGLPFRMPAEQEIATYEWAAYGIAYSLFQLSGAEFITSLVLSGVCERHPGFKFVLGECGVGWLPYILERMDEQFEKLPQLTLKLKPSDYWRRQGYTTFQTEKLTQEIVEQVGAESILWGSDYPHADGLFPDSQNAIQEDLGHLSPEVQRKLVCDNAARLYGLPL